MGFPHAGAPMSSQVCSAIRVYCPDCRRSVGLFGYEPLPWLRHHPSGLLEPDRAELALWRHAQEMPLLHPTVLPSHHHIARAREATR